MKDLENPGKQVVSRYQIWPSGKDTFPYRSSWHFQLGKGTRVGPGLAGGMTNPGWPGSALGSCKRGIAGYGCRLGLLNPQRDSKRPENLAVTEAGGKSLGEAMEEEFKFVLSQLGQTEQDGKKQVSAETVKEDFESFLTEPVGNSVKLSIGSFLLQLLPARMH